MAGHGEARRGEARLGWAGRGMARLGLTWQGTARHGEGAVGRPLPLLASRDHENQEPYLLG
jgi:hypothetical protein